MKLNISSILLLFLPFVCFAEEELYDCVPDATGQFYVEGTEGNGMRYCEWAARKHTEQRCKIEVVAWQCPITCEVPCIDRDGSGAVIGAAVVTPRVEKDKFPTSWIVTICVFGLVAVAALVGFGMRNRNREVDFEDDLYEESKLEDGGDPQDNGDEVIEEELPDPIEPTRQSSVSTDVVTRAGPSCCDPC